MTRQTHIQKQLHKQPHYLCNWKKYLNLEDYEYLIEYIENIKNDIPNDKMIILSGTSRNNNTTIKTDIQTYLGYELCSKQGNLCELIYC